MRSLLRPRLALAAQLLAAAACIAGPADTRSSAPRFEISLDPAACDAPYSGRVYLMTTTRAGREPVNGPGWFGSEPFFAYEVRDWKPGEKLVVDADKTLGFPKPLADLPAGKYFVQAVISLNTWSRRVTNAPGNAYSKVVSFEHDPQNPPTVRLRIDQRVPKPKLEDSEEVKFVRLRSRLLSEFHKRDVYLQAAVGLPVSYADEPDRKFPAIYVIPGFSGDIVAGGRSARYDPYAAEDLDIVRIYLDPECPTGHDAFADSANNGPVGQALIEELIPHLEKQFRLIRDAGARYVTGHSSGGWSSLWLQVEYPDTFGGCWSLAPDPVDFRSFQLTNIYDSDDNVYYEPDGSLRPVARGRDRAMKPFVDVEEVLGRGGQMGSFEAVFSPRGADGQPAKLWDRTTGKLDARVARAWKKYDIALKLKREWSSLGPRLAGKLHVFCGDRDTFFLDGAVLKLRDELKELGSDAYVEIVPGAGHGLTPGVRSTVAHQVAEQFARFRK